MHLVSTILVLTLVTSAIAAAQITVVEVGGNSSTSGGPVQFIPASITASNGSIVTFRFSGAPGNHTVTQSSFSNPCQLLSGGFDSGWIYVPPSVSSDFAEWNLTITNDSEPIWYYCKQLKSSPHCKAGMVGSINAPTSGNNTFSAFQTAAENSSGNPGQGEGGLVGQGASASAPAGPFSDGVTGYSIPTGTAPPSTTSTTSSKGAATHLIANGPVLFGVPAFGVLILGFLHLEY